MPQFFRDLMKCLDSLSMERDQRAVYIFQKVPILPYPSDSPMAKYTALLTPFAMSYLATQMSHSASVTIVRDIDDDSHAVEVQSSKGLLIVTPDLQAHLCSAYYGRN